MNTLHPHAYLKRVSDPTFLIILRLHSIYCPLALPKMFLESDIKDMYQPSTNHGVAVCKNSTMNQA